MEEPNPKLTSSPWYSTQQLVDGSNGEEEDLDGLLGMPSTYQSTLEMTPTTYKKQCNEFSYLVKRQQELCGLNLNILQSVGFGAKMGIDECQHQFRNHRWNCSTFMNTSTVFGGILQSKSPETAYIYSISAAGVAYSITRACNRGEITECGCDDRIRNRKPRGNWQWGGCSEDVRFGESFSKDFVDSREDRETGFGLMNLHNNEAGRRAIRKQMELVCKCHGISGACTIKVCWRRMKPFRFVGGELLRRFKAAYWVRMVVRKKKRRLKPRKRNFKKPTKRDLVYIDFSPDYCNRNLKLGVLGTQGRRCNVTSDAADSCSLLCCGRGHHIIVQEVEEKCNCKFVWCCKVQCDMCKLTKEFSFCN